MPSDYMDSIVAKSKAKHSKFRKVILTYLRKSGGSAAIVKMKHDLEWDCKTGKPRYAHSDVFSTFWAMVDQEDLEIISNARVKLRS